MSCVLRFSASDCDIDAIAATVELPVEYVYRRGEPRHILRKQGPFIKSGFQIVASEAEFDEFEQQITDTIAFIKAYQTGLQKLAALAIRLKDYQLVFDFGITTRMFEVGAQVDYFPPELLRLVSELSAGIALSQYPPSEDDEQSPAIQ